jgi:hypothetical protein
MTIRCMNCNHVLGEKCKICGSFAVSQIERIEVAAGIYRWQGMAVCSNRRCGRVFFPGDGGQTSGVCEVCYKNEMAKLDGVYGPELSID